MQHHYDVEIAKEYGINAAVILENIRFWVAHNEANGTNFNDGRYWTYNSAKAFEQLFPEIKPFAVRTALKTLEESGLIMTGNYNKVPYDRTKWYTLTDKANAMFSQLNSICGKPQMECEKSHTSTRDIPQIDSMKTSNGSEENRKPIPDGKPDREPSVKQSDGKPDEKRPYGIYGNVKLTDTELGKLKAEFPDWEARIENLSTYMASTGKTYKNHLATIRNWARRDSQKAQDTATKVKRPPHAPAATAVPTVEQLMSERGISRDEAEDMLLAVF